MNQIDDSRTGRLPVPRTWGDARRHPAFGRPGRGDRKQRFGGPVLIALIVMASTAASSSGGMRLPAVSVAARLPAEAIRDTADKVMQQKDYRSVRRRVLENVPTASDDDPGFLWSVLESVGEAISDFLEWMFSGFTAPNAPAQPQSPTTSAPSSSGTSGGGGFGRLLVGVAIGIVVIVVAWIVATILRNSAGMRKPDSSGLFGDETDLADLSVPPGELAASTYEGRAIQMAHEGNYRAAIRELLIGSMSWIERAGLIRYRKGLTNRNYVRAIWKQEDRRSAYAMIAIEFERVYFGRRTATAEMFQDCLAGFQGAFHEEETPATV